MQTQITPQTIDRIISAVDKLCDSVDGEESRVAAAAKVAAADKLTPEQIQLVCRSYNDGVVNTTRRSSEKFASKFAVPGLIDPAQVIDKVFDRTPKTASDVTPVASVYAKKVSRPTVKTASQRVEYTPPRCDCGCGERPERCKTAGMTDYAKAKQKLAVLKEAKRLAWRAKTAAASAVANVSAVYFDKHGDDPQHFPLYAKFASDLYGQTGKGVVDLAASRDKSDYQVKKYAHQRDAMLTGAQAPVVQVLPRDERSGVLLAVKQAVEAIAEWGRAAELLPVIAIKAHRAARQKEAVEALKGRLLIGDTTYEQLVDAQWEKRASVLSGAMGAVFGNTMASAIVDETKSVSSRMQEARRLLNDAPHAASLKSLNAEYLLNRLVQSDEVIGSYPPEEVADAFEELATSSPAVVNNPTLLRANLRRNLQGNLTPYEADELVATGNRGDAISYLPLQGLPEDPFDARKMMPKPSK
jgi:hypothetical protein